MKTMRVIIISLCVVLGSIGWALNAIAAEYDPLTKRAQKRLAELEYDAGPIDGKIGPKTIAALKKFQQDHDLAVTGKLDEETLRKLGFSSKTQPVEQTSIPTVPSVVRPEATPTAAATPVKVVGVALAGYDESTSAVYAPTETSGERRGKGHLKKWGIVAVLGCLCLGATLFLSSRSKNWIVFFKEKQREQWIHVIQTSFNNRWLSWLAKFDSHHLLSITKVAKRIRNYDSGDRDNLKVLLDILTKDSVIAEELATAPRKSFIQVINACIMVNDLFKEYIVPELNQYLPSTHRADSSSYVRYRFDNSFCVEELTNIIIKLNLGDPDIFSRDETIYGKMLLAEFEKKFHSNQESFIEREYYSDSPYGGGDNSMMSSR